MAIRCRCRRNRGIWRIFQKYFSTGALDENQFPLFDSLKYTIEYALAQNWYGYSSCTGRDSARKSIALLENTILQKGNFYTEENVCVILGVTAGLTDVMHFIKKKKNNDKLVTLTHIPSYAPFITTCEECGDVVYFSLDEDGIDVDKIINIINGNIDVLLVTGDLNPIGRTTSREDLERISRACLEKSVYFIYDRAGRKNGMSDYEAFQIHEKAIIMESMSKKISVPGMKIGYFLAEKEFVDGFYEYASTYYGGPISFFYLLLEFDSMFTKYYLEGKEKITEEDLLYYEDTYKLNIEWLQASYENYVSSLEFNHRVMELQREICCIILAKTPRVKKIIKPETGVNVFALIDYDKTSYQFYEDLIQSKGVAIFPGICSGLDKGCWIRITISGEYSNLVKGVRRISEFLSEQEKRI